MSRAMAGMGINLAASATITQLLEGKPSFDHVTPFGHQRDAFRDDIVRGQTEKLAIFFIMKISSGMRPCMQRWELREWKQS